MRTIEREIINAIKDKREAILSKRDHVSVDAISVKYILWNSVVLALYDDRIEAGVKDGRYQTVTTKSRINALSIEFGLPGIAQKKHVWTWTDGEPYTGVRVFPRG